MLYLLDANILITANNQYYPIDQVPEFWSWLQHQAMLGYVKIPYEIMDEILAGHKKGDLLLDWIKEPANKEALLLDETVDGDLVLKVSSEGYAWNLTDDEIQVIGRDPFLIAYGLAREDRCVVTNEASSPGKKREKRKIPDVCDTMQVKWCGPFVFNRALGFSTNWKP